MLAECESRVIFISNVLPTNTNANQIGLALRERVAHKFTRITGCVNGLRTKRNTVEFTYKDTIDGTR